MKSTGIELDAYLKVLLNRLRQVSPLDPESVTEAREKFLAQGEVFHQAGSQQPSRRQLGWIHNIFAFQRKPRTGLLRASLVIILLIVVGVGGVGTTAYAAQGSLPDETLYPVKTWSEDFRLSLSGSPQSELALLLDFTDRRMDEIDSLHTAGKPIPGVLFSRFESHLDAALQIAAGMGEPQMIQGLIQICQRAVIQSYKIAAWMDSGLGQVFPELVRLQERLQEQARLAAAGQADPQGFRMQVQQRMLTRQNIPSHTPNQPGSPSPTPNTTPVPTGNSYGPGPGGGLASGTPGGYAPGGSNPSQTPAPTGGSFGPGPGAGQQTATPGSYGPGPNAGTSTGVPTQGGAGATPTFQTGGPGSGNPNPSATVQPGGTASGTGQPPVTPPRGGNP
jgi:hypothetical protein